MELIINVAMGHGEFSVVAGGERKRERREFYCEMIDAGVIQLEANQETLAVILNINNMTLQKHQTLHYMKMDDCTVHRVVSTALLFIWRT